MARPYPGAVPGKKEVGGAFRWGMSGVWISQWAMGSAFWGRELAVQFRPRKRKEVSEAGGGGFGPLGVWTFPGLWAAEVRTGLGLGRRAG